MKYSKLLSAVKALNKIAQINLPFKKSYEIFLLNKKIQPHISFFEESQKKIINNCGGQIKDDGRVYFDTQQQIIEYQNKINEIYNIEIANNELDIVAIDLPLAAVESVEITPAEIMALQNFINFIEE